MGRLRFDDGMEFDTSGEPRIEERRDGLYVVGRGMLLPADDRGDAERLLEEMRTRGEESDE